MISCEKLRQRFSTCTELKVRVAVALTGQWFSDSVEETQLEMKKKETKALARCLSCMYGVGIRDGAVASR